MSMRARYAVLALAAAAGSAALTAVIVRAGTDPPRPADPAPASHPATQPETKYPPDALVAACKQAADRLRGRLDRSFNFAVSPPFVVAGNCPPRRLDQYVQGCVVQPAEVMWKSYFEKKPTGVITVLLFADGPSYRRWAKELFGDTELPHFGYCRGDGTTLMDISTGGGTLVHEVTHALIKYDFPGVPDWFNEGLGSLHEQCTVGEDRIVGHENWRLPALQKAIRDGRLRPLRELVTADDFYGPLRGTNYAHARYFVMYMQQRGVLEKFYKTLRDGYAQRAEIPACLRQVGRRNAALSSNRQSMAVSAIEASLGLPIDEIDKSMRKWVMTLKFR